MPTVGLRSIYYAPIKSAADGRETYGTPKLLAKAISAEFSIDMAEATFYADDMAQAKITEFKGGKIKLGIDELGRENTKALLGSSIDGKGVSVSSSEDRPQPVAIGFCAPRHDGRTQYTWLYKVLFAIPDQSYATKGDSIEFNTPTIEGAILPRVKAVEGKHPWLVNAIEGESDATVVSGWFSSVYEPEGLNATGNSSGGRS